MDHGTKSAPRQPCQRHALASWAPHRSRVRTAITTATSVFTETPIRIRIAIRRRIRRVCRRTPTGLSFRLRFRARVCDLLQRRRAVTGRLRIHRVLVLLSVQSGDRGRRESRWRLGGHDDRADGRRNALAYVEFSQHGTWYSFLPANVACGQGETNTEPALPLVPRARVSA